MINDPLRLSDYLTHILQAIERIIRYTESTDFLRCLNNLKI